MEDRVHFALGCSHLDPVRQNYQMKIQSILSRIDVSVNIKICDHVKPRTADAVADELDQSCGVKGSLNQRYYLC